MKIVFDFDEKKCSACAACAVACMDQNDVDVEGGQSPYRRVYQYESRGGEFVSMSISCAHCENAPCAGACPMGCLRKDAETGLTLYDTAECIGCRACYAACPYGAPTFRRTGTQEKMEKCDGCLERIRAGMTPACVLACPTGALSWRWAEDGTENPLRNIYDRWNALTASDPPKGL